MNEDKNLNEELRARLLKPLDQIQAEKMKATNQIERPTESDFMTLTKYISNPTGKGTAYVANRQAIKSGLNMMYIKLLREHRREFYAMPFIYENGDLLMYVKVPSEDYEHNKISYDVLFLLKYNQQLKRANRQMTLYSNSPSFIFTYCYVYNQHGLIIDKLKNKLPNEALTKFPEIRNPIGSLGYEKSTYIAAMYLIDGKCLSDEYINRFGKIMTPQLEAQTFNKIADPELLVAVYQHAQYQQRKEHKKELSANEKAKRDQVNKDYARQQKKNKPAGTFVTHKSPSAKLTAKQAKKNLMNQYKKK